MPVYQDYVVARDDHDPDTGTGGSVGKSRVVRTRTFLMGNLDRSQMNKSSPMSDLAVGAGHTLRE